MNCFAKRLFSSKIEMDGVTGKGILYINNSSDEYSTSGNRELRMESSESGAEDADEVNNDSGTSSFSLQECMNEFRARRIRRISSTRHRTGVYKCGTNGNDDAEELDLINQNLCNKVQERKCKPCENGFCYCFTSDSGDSYGNLGHPKFLNIPDRNSRRNGCSKCVQLKKIQKNVFYAKQPVGHIIYDQKHAVGRHKSVKSGRNIANNLKAISSIETNTKDSPLLHIIQELRENCVITKVMVNKHNMITFGNNTILNERKTFVAPQNQTHFANEQLRKQNGRDNYLPTAPTLENILNVETSNVMSNAIKKPRRCRDAEGLQRGIRTRSAGGHLLQKRLSISQLSCMPTDNINPPQKPPRASVYEDKYSSDSFTPISPVCTAEHVVNDFWEHDGCNGKLDVGPTYIKKIKETELSKTKTFESNKRKSFISNKKDINTQTDGIKSRHSSNEIEKIVEADDISIYDQNIISTADSERKVISVGWNESKIKNMMNYDLCAKPTRFFSSGQPQTQHIVNDTLEKDEKNIGWTLPSKINLDTVDGIMHHNLASNFDTKNTPVKETLSSSSQDSRYGIRYGKFPWSEQLRHLYPWSIKCKVDQSNNSKCKSHSSSKAFIISSKKKLLNLLSPKKENRERRNKLPYRNVSVQTSSYDVFGQTQHKSNLQSHRISYLSPKQTLQGALPDLTRFDFSRNVHPSKKSFLSTQRNSKFPVNFASQGIDTCASSAGVYQNKTYHSFHSELDQDVSISKINCILSNIRTKLESIDQHAVRTFLEAEPVVNHNSDFGYPDIHREKRIEEREKVYKNCQVLKTNDNFNEPIYSEIEDDKVYLSECPEFGNHTGIRHFVAADNPDILYAKIKKSNKCQMEIDKSQYKTKKKQIPLANIMNDSLKSKKVISNIIPLPALPEPSAGESTSYSMSVASNSPVSHNQSLNNVIEVDPNSSPKKQQNFSKSDFSPQFSEIFLENLFKSELVIYEDLERKMCGNLQKEKNYISNDSVTESSENDIVCIPIEGDQNIAHYTSGFCELPDDKNYCFYELSVADNSTIADSNIFLSTIAPPSANNQSTPKKQSFVTKDKPITRNLFLDAETEDINNQLYTSRPNTPGTHSDVYIIDKKKSWRALSMNEVSEYESFKITNVNALQKLYTFKNVLHKSFRKSKAFLRKKGKNLSTSLNFVPSSILASDLPRADCKLDLEDLFAINESATITEQIEQTVSICRKLPALEISTEMVEAERLLLFSTLRRENQQSLSTALTNHNIKHKTNKSFFIDNIYLPIVSDVNEDIFYNYFYIITFECCGIIKSTQSAECVNGVAVFHESGIEFVHFSELETDEKKQSAIKCNIFMLQLRKVSTVLFEPKENMIENLTPTNATTLSPTSSLSEVVSRFRLHASFTINDKDFVPYEYVHQESHCSDQICIRSSCFRSVPLTIQSKTNLSGELRFKGRAELRIPKHAYEGFLNVQDPQKQHNWNKRWCTIDGIFLYVWQDENSLNVLPLIAIDLRYCKHNINCPLACSPRNVCARSRSFCLECKSDKSFNGIFSIYFAADTQKDLEDWLNNLNIVLDFIAGWL